jgi:hypothetical protein
MNVQEVLHSFFDKSRSGAEKFLFKVNRAEVRSLLWFIGTKNIGMSLAIRNC